MRKEITLKELHTDNFISEKINEIKNIVGEGTAINALSGGIDSSVVTLLGHRALGPRLRTIFVDNGLMREGESSEVIKMFSGFGIDVEVLDARDKFSPL